MKSSAVSTRGCPLRQQEERDKGHPGSTVPAMNQIEMHPFNQQRELARNVGKSPAQVMIRFLLRRGIVAVPKSAECAGGRRGITVTRPIGTAVQTSRTRRNVQYRGCVGLVEHAAPQRVLAGRLPHAVLHPPLPAERPVGVLPLGGAPGRRHSRTETSATSS